MYKFIKQKMIFIVFLIMPCLLFANVQLMSVTNKRYVLAQQLIKVTKLQYRIKNAIHHEIPIIMKQDSIYQQHKKQFSKLLAKYTSWNNLEPIYVQLYAKTFTAKELAGLINLFQSPYGQIYVGKMSNFIIAEDAVIQRYMQEILPHIYTESRQIALTDLKQKANKGNAQAAAILGSYYLKSKKKQEQKLAFIWLQKAANKGDIAAMNNLAFAYSHGLGTKKNLTQAINWYQKAASSGDQIAMFNLGLYYFYGVSVKQDYQKSLSLFKKASFRDEPYAQFMLAKIYLTGKDVKKDKNKGINWLTLVAYRYYDPHFTGEVQKRDQYINTFINYQLAQFLGKKPNYEKETTQKMIQLAKDLSQDIEEACLVNSYNS